MIDVRRCRRRPAAMHMGISSYRYFAKSIQICKVARTDLTNMYISSQVRLTSSPYSWVSTRASGVLVVASLSMEKPSCRPRPRPSR